MVDVDELAASMRWLLQDSFGLIIGTYPDDREAITIIQSKIAKTGAATFSYSIRSAGWSIPTAGRTPTIRSSGTPSSY